MIEDEMEVAIDVRRCRDVSLRELTGELLRACYADAGPSRIHLEPWLATSVSVIREFNPLTLDDSGPGAAGHRPGLRPGPAGWDSDARNRDLVREVITALFALWGSLAERNALPEELYVVELGVGNGSQAKTWLDEFAERDRDHGRGYYRRLHYLMCDYSPHVFELARAVVADHSNVYDNLLTDEVAQIGVNIVTQDVDVTGELHVCYGNRYARSSWEGHYNFLFLATLPAESRGRSWQRW
jgi:hypothetical protein